MEVAYRRKTVTAGWVRAISWWCSVRNVGTDKNWAVVRGHSFQPDEKFQAFLSLYTGNTNVDRNASLASVLGCEMPLEPVKPGGKNVDQCPTFLVLTAIQPSSFPTLLVYCISTLFSSCNLLAGWLTDLWPVLRPRRSRCRPRRPCKNSGGLQVMQTSNPRRRAEKEKEQTRAGRQARKMDVAWGWCDKLRASSSSSCRADPGLSCDPILEMPMICVSYPPGLPTMRSPASASSSFETKLRVTRSSACGRLSFDSSLLSSHS
ncbi:hypothetical protein V8F20_005755 [Naviculisporaceae sp. PSN 640]